MNTAPLLKCLALFQYGHQIYFVRLLNFPRNGVFCDQTLCQFAFPEIHAKEVNLLFKDGRIRDGNGTLGWVKNGKAIAYINCEGVQGRSILFTDEQLLFGNAEGKVITITPEQLRLRWIKKNNNYH